MHEDLIVAVLRAALVLLTRADEPGKACQVLRLSIGLTDASHVELPLSNLLERQSPAHWSFIHQYLLIATLCKLLAVIGLLRQHVLGFVVYSIGVLLLDVFFAQSVCQIADVLVPRDHIWHDYHQDDNHGQFGYKHVRVVVHVLIVHNKDGAV